VSIGSLQVHTGYLTFSFKKPWCKAFGMVLLPLQAALLAVDAMKNNIRMQEWRNRTERMGQGPHFKISNFTNKFHC